MGLNPYIVLILGRKVYDSKSLDARFLSVKEHWDAPGTSDKPFHMDMIISLKHGSRARRCHGITLHPGYVSGAPRGSKVYIHGLETQTPLYRSVAWNRDANSGRACRRRRQPTDRAICFFRWVNPSNELFDSDLSKRYLNRIDKMNHNSKEQSTWKITTLSHVI